MGAGIGKTKMELDYRRWTKFVNAGAIGSQSLEQYYEIPKMDKTKMAERIASDLFADMVALGCLQLPPGVKISDFGFKVKNKKPLSYARYTTKTLVMTRKGRTEDANVTTYPEYHLEGRKKFLSRAVNNVVCEIGRATELLVNE